MCVWAAFNRTLPAASTGEQAGRRAGSQVHDTTQDKKEEATRSRSMWGTREKERKRDGERTRTRETESWTRNSHQNSQECESHGIARQLDFVNEWSSISTG